MYESPIAIHTQRTIKLLIKKLEQTIDMEIKEPSFFLLYSNFYCCVDFRWQMNRAHYLYFFSKYTESREIQEF